MTEKLGIIKKHADTVAVLGGILASVLWMNGKFSELEKELFAIKANIVKIETVLIVKGIMPSELAANTGD